MTHWTEDLFLDDAETFALTMRQRLDQTGEEVDTLLGLFAEYDVDPNTVLDVACGIGRHAVELGEVGMEVHGIDISSQYIESARERAADRGVSDRVSFEVADMRDLQDRGETYDLVTNMWTAFGYFDEATNEAVAAGFHDSLAPDGTLVMELANKEAIMAEYSESGVSQSDGILYVERSEYTPETGRMETTLTLFESGENSKEADPDPEESGQYEPMGEISWDTRLYSPAELRRLLELAGFSEVSLYGGLDGSPLEIDSHRVVVVARP